MNDHARLALTVGRMRAIAARNGTMDPWWDSIFDAEVVLAGGLGIVYKTVPEALSCCNKLLLERRGDLMNEEPNDPVIAAYPILKFFRYEHLKPELQDISKPFSEIAWTAAQTPTSNRAELAAGLRKLLEAKDCIVRAALP